MADMKMPPVKYDVVILKGGLDQVTPTLNMSSGAVRDAVNYECAVTGGYSRIVGMERTDGQASPTDNSQNFVVLGVSGSTYPALGITVSGASSGATAKLVYNSGTQHVLIPVSGSFTTGENLMNGATFIGANTGIAATTALQDAQYTQYVADYYRAFIQKVPGSGAIRGVCVIGSTMYAFRDNVAVTSCDLYKSTTGGWVKISYGKYVTFDTGTGTISDGDTVTGQTSGATGVVMRSMLESGAWATNAAGKLVFASITGTFQVGENLRVGGVTQAVCRSANTQIAQSPGGKYEMALGNFTGRSTTQRIYGCDNVNRGFEFDGTTFCPITTGMPTDAPKHVAVFKNHLHWAFGSSSLNSGVGKPYNYTSTAGAAETAVGEDITGYLVQPGSQNTAAMTIYTRENVFILYGTSSANWNLVAYNTGVGAVDYSQQNMNSSYQMSAKGISALTASLNYGNFDQATLTANILPFIRSVRNKVNCSALCREKSQYRLYFNDGSGLYLTVVNGQYMGAMPVSFPVAMNVAWESELPTGEEIILTGGSDGYVYRHEKGTSFDGAAIYHYLTLNFNTAKSPRMLKRYRKASLEVQGSGYAEIGFGYSLGYGSSEIPQGSTVSYATNFAVPKWDNFTWDNFIWDGRTIQPNEIELTGTGENIQVTLSGNSNYYAPYTVNSIITHYTVRRGLR
jgi:hypothetical protein